MAGGGSGGGQQTVTQTQQIPEWQRQYAQENEAIAASLASRPYQTYEGQTIAGFSPQQQAGMNMTNQAANSYQPNLSSAEGLTAQAASPWDTNAAMQFMNPYTMAALAPQLQQAEISRQMQQRDIDKQATQAGAFGDARHGAAQGLQNYYSDLNRSNIVGQGMNQAYNSALGAFQNQQQNLLGAGGQFANLAGQQQQLGLGGANALFNMGTQEQQLQQQQLTQAYNNFMNQQNWGPEQLNLRIAALANSPYNVTNQTSLAPGNATAANIGAFSTLAGAAGNLLGQGGGQTGGIYGGAK